MKTRTVTLITEILLLLISLSVFIIMQINMYNNKDSLIIINLFITFISLIFLLIGLFVIGLQIEIASLNIRWWS